MGVYSVDKLITETRRIAREYRLATGKTLPVTQEIAINDAISILNLRPNNDTSRAYDAYFDLEEDETLKVQIKGRTIFNEKKSGHRIGQLKLEQEWDAIILVIMDADFMPQEIYMARRADILEEIEDKEALNKKGPITVAKFKIISELLWTEQNGLEQGSLWTNTASS